MAGYPNTLDNMVTNHVDLVNEKIMAAVLNDLADAVNKIERAVGVLPADIYASLAVRVAAIEIPVFNDQTASYVLQATDRSKIVRVNSATATTVTIPLNATVPFPIGTQIQVRQAGTGAITIAGATSGVTVVNPYTAPGTPIVTFGQYAMVTLTKTATDQWGVNGDVA